MGKRGRNMRLFVVAAFVAALMALGTSAAFAGEITGNGTLKEPNGNSSCSFSGQEDLQWYTNNGDGTLRDDPTRGDPAHSQNWGHVKQETGLPGGASGNKTPLYDPAGNPTGCNGNLFGMH